MNKKGGYNPYENPQNRPSSAPTQASTTYSQPISPTPMRPSPSVSVIHDAKTLPENYVDLAESTINALKQEMDADRRAKPITATKLRNLFNLFSDTFNECLRMDADTLTDTQISTLRTARVRIVYECGRDDTVKHFVKKTQMLDFLFGIGNQKSEMIRYYHYLEALVAYGRFAEYTKDDK